MTLTSTMDPILADGLARIQREVEERAMPHVASLAGAADTEEKAEGHEY